MKNLFNNKFTQEMLFEHGFIDMDKTLHFVILQCFTNQTVDCTAAYKILEHGRLNRFENRFMKRKKGKQYQTFTNLKIIHTKKTQGPEVKIK